MSISISKPVKSCGRYTKKEKPVERHPPRLLPEKDGKFQRPRLPRASYLAPPLPLL